MVGDWVIAGSALLLSSAGALFGWRSGRIKSKAWLVLFFAPLVLTLAITLSLRYPMTRVFPPLHWMVAGRTEYVLLAGSLSLMIWSLIPRLERKLLRILVATLCAIVVLLQSVAPFVLPPMLKERHLRMITQIDSNGVCRQQTDYTCGPASAVTALRQLGISTTEGEMANLLHTTPIGGTELDIAADYLEAAYGKQDIHFQYRVARSITNLPANTPILAVRFYSTRFHHIIAVMRDEHGEVVVHDPITGQGIISVEAFDKIFEGESIVITRGD